MTLFLESEERERERETVKRVSHLCKRAQLVRQRVQHINKRALRCSARLTLLSKEERRSINMTAWGKHSGVNQKKTRATRRRRRRKTEKWRQRRENNSYACTFVLERERDTHLKELYTSAKKPDLFAKESHLSAKEIICTHAHWPLLKSMLQH